MLNTRDEDEPTSALYAAYFVCPGAWLRGYKAYFMLNSAKLDAKLHAQLS